MSEQAHEGAEEHLGRFPSDREFSLRRMVERGIQAMAEEGRTMERWLAENEKLREQGLLPSLTREQRTRAYEEARAEREAR
jgi:hypothetical protein